MRTWFKLEGKGGSPELSSAPHPPRLICTCTLSPLAGSEVGRLHPCGYRSSQASRAKISPESARCPPRMLPCPPRMTSRLGPAHHPGGSSSASLAIRSSSWTSATAAKADAFTLDLFGNGRFVMLSDPEVVREVLRADPDVLHSGEANAVFIATVGRHSVLVLDEAPHARARRVLVPPLKGERMRAFFDAMRLETLEAIRVWPRDVPTTALPLMRRITLRVILRTALGLAPGSEMDRFEHKIDRVLSNGRQRYALVLITIIPINKFSGSRWVPLFRQLRNRP